MIYNSADYKAYVEKLKIFKEYDWVQNFLYLGKKPNFWTIIEYGRVESSRDRSAHETRYSKMIRWLMDPNETHHLGNIFAHKLIDLIDGDYKYMPVKNKTINVINEFMDIDVFYKDPTQKMCIAIEVKQFAKEGITADNKSQLDKYEELLEEWIKDKHEEIQPYYIYLTATKDKPSNKNWLAVGYEELINIIDEVYDEYIVKSDDMYIEDTKKIILDFKDDLQRSMYLEVKDRGINEVLSDKEKKLTQILANEIQEETDSKHLDNLMAVAQDELPELEQLIMMVDEHLHRQDHTPNATVQILLRKIYNYLSGEKQLNTDKIIEYKAGETITPLKNSLMEQYNLELSEINLTGGKGQGLYLHHKEGKYRIYLSGDGKGHFPNDYIHLLPPKGDKRVNAKTIKNRQFRADKDLILENKISDKDGYVIDLEYLMENYVMKSIKELDALAIEKNYNK